MKTQSMWGAPPGRFYGFLQRVEAGVRERPIVIGILGCADGKFVLPCARRGHRVFAVDLDPVALFGSSANGHRNGVQTAGLIQRLKKENLEKYVSVFCDDLAAFIPPRRCHAVFSSGTINYLSDARCNVPDMIHRIATFVDAGGFVYFDYRLPLRGERSKDRYYFQKGELRSYFQPPGWRLIYDRVLPPQFEKSHIGAPGDHFHRWGHLCAQKEQAL